VTDRLMCPLVTATELRDALGSGAEIRVLDATTHLHTSAEGVDYTATTGEVDFRAAHIPGAVFADVPGALSDPEGAELFTLPSPDRFAAAMGELGVGSSTHVVVYDTVGSAWATRVWWLLRVFGHDAVSVLDGGLAAWTGAGLPTEAGAGRPDAPSVPFAPRVRPELVATKDEIVRTLPGSADAAPGTAAPTADLVICALDPATFAGAPEISPYARRGRIPGSRNLPLYTLLDPDSGRFLAPDALAERLDAQGVRAARRTVTYCGGGIAATLPAFAAYLVDGTEVAVYDGSLSEWTRDESLPVEVG
jgi:thiosulfate/3-mercaptopyruvate sulfurtransferase